MVGRHVYESVSLSLGVVKVRFMCISILSCRDKTTFEEVMLQVTFHSGYVGECYRKKRMIIKR